MILTATFLTSCLKLLLIPAYKSTDFEVHRNWMAITHSLPIKNWYYESTSEWTLDYPPLFAFFEYFLSQIAQLFDRQMLVVHNLNYASNETVLFQRLSVIITDLIYAYGAHKCCSSMRKSWRTDVVLPILLVTNCGLIMIDHIHFQYNGILYGILLISIACIFQGKYIQSGFWFSVLLNMKHIYIYLAPAYFVFLLRHYVLKGTTHKNCTQPNWLVRLMKLGSVVIAVFLVTFLPFYNQLPQVLSRLFPFKRGLCHAYWAPNFWAVYNSLDKILHITLSKLGILSTKQGTVASMTGGLVQEFSHSVLPNITPLVTIILTGLTMLPALFNLWTLSKHPVHFLRCVVLCALSSFLFGWHVHEKAILMAIIPLSILAVLDARDASTFLVLSVLGHYSLFPLLFPSSLLLVKVLLILLYSTYSFHSLSKVYPTNYCRYSFPRLSGLESGYIVGLGVVFLYENFIHQLLGLNSKLPYLPLLVTSLYCAVGIVHAWVRFYVKFMTRSGDPSIKLNKKIQ